LSGSGKTYTVFGPDDPSIPDAWFKVSKPVANWGLLPRLAYDLFGMQDQSWKFSLKYFQNVIDIVRDLLSPTGEESHYKQGMHKDDDGFMDIRYEPQACHGLACVAAFHATCACCVCFGGHVADTGGASPKQSVLGTNSESRSTSPINASRFHRPSSITRAHAVTAL